jgi:hypothetical protein
MSLLFYIEFHFNRFELVSDPKTKIDATKYFEIVPKQGGLTAGGDRNAPATSVTVSTQSDTIRQMMPRFEHSPFNRQSFSLTVGEDSHQVNL